MCEVIFTRRARKFMSRFPRREDERVLRAIEGIAEEVGGWLERENRRTRLPKSALLESLAEQSIRTRRFPGIGLRGQEHARRAWVIGTGLDVWELVELYEGKERLLSELEYS